MHSVIYAFQSLTLQRQCNVTLFTALEREMAVSAVDAPSQVLSTRGS